MDFYKIWKRWSAYGFLRDLLFSCKICRKMGSGQVKSVTEVLPLWQASQERRLRRCYDYATSQHIVSLSTRMADWILANLVGIGYWCYPSLHDLLLWWPVYKDGHHASNWLSHFWLLCNISTNLKKSWQEVCTRRTLSSRKKDNAHSDHVLRSHKWIR